MKILTLIRLYAIWALAVIILITGFWIDKTEMIDMFPASLFTIPIFFILIPLGWVYFYLAKYIKSGIFFHVKEVIFWYTIAYGLLFIEKPVEMIFFVSNYIMLFFQTKASFYLISLGQVIVICIFIATFFKKR